MADLITWSGNGGISFFIKSNEIRGVKDFSISASAETEDKTQSSEKFIKKKNSGSYQISITAVLNAALGVDVQTLALKMTEAARKGDTGYFYTATSKLFPSKFMATDAKVNNIQMTGSGKWSYCEVALTLKQCSKFDGGTSGSSGGSSNTSGSSTKKRSTTSTTKKTTLGDAIGKVVSTVKTVASKVKSAVTSVVSTISAAKKASSAAKTNLTTKKTNPASSLVSKVKSIFKK